MSWFFGMLALWSVARAISGVFFPPRQTIVHTGGGERNEIDVRITITGPGDDPPPPPPPGWKQFKIPLPGWTPKPQPIVPEPIKNRMRGGSPSRN